MKKYLITGINSGLGKFLHENIPNSDGLHRNNFDEIKDNYYDVIVNCAFNKELEISNYKQYLNDNILLNLNLKKQVSPHGGILSPGRSFQRTNPSQ